MSSLPPPPDDLPEPAGDPVPGLDHPTGAISGSWSPPVDSGSVPPQFPPPQVPQSPPPQVPQFPPPPSPFPVPPPGALPPPPGPGPGMPVPPGGWIQPEAYGELPPPPQFPPGGPGAPYGGGYQAYRPGMRPMVSYAGFWARFGATLIDGLVTGIVPAVLYGVGIATSSQELCTTTSDAGGSYTSCTADLGDAGPFLIAAFLAYAVLSFFVVIRPIGLTGQSIGSRATSVRVVDSGTGQPIGVGRSLGRFVAALFISRWCCNLGYLWMLWDDRKQTWHDKLSSSVVVTA